MSMYPRVTPGNTVAKSSSPAPSLESNMSLAAFGPLMIVNSGISEQLSMILSTVFPIRVTPYHAQNYIIISFICQLDNCIIIKLVDT